MVENCAICKKPTSGDLRTRDIRVVRTRSSDTQMLAFLETVTEAAFAGCEFEACANCCALVDELDEIQERFRAVRDKLTAFLNTAEVAAKTCDDSEATGIQAVKRKNKTHECKSCRRKFASRSGFSMHVRRSHPTEVEDVTETKEIKVEDENKSAFDVSEAKSDDDGKAKRKGDAGKSSHECPTCEKSFKTRGGLKNHMSSHDDARPYICEICGQGYKNRGALNVHVGMHNGINPFTCVCCNKSFTQKGALRRHMPIHTGEAPYQCDLCGKRFVHHTSFHIHQLSHSGRKMYKCGVCALALFSGSHLKRHMRVHTGERNYACPVCGKRFAEKYNLASHQKLHDGAGNGKSAKRSCRYQMCESGYEKQVKLEERSVEERRPEMPANCVPHGTEPTSNQLSVKAETS